MVHHKVVLKAYELDQLVARQKDKRSISEEHNRVVFHENERTMEPHALNSHANDENVLEAMFQHLDEHIMIPEFLNLHHITIEREKV